MSELKKKNNVIINDKINFDNARIKFKSNKLKKKL